MSAQADSFTLVIPAPALLEHWQGHRRLTRRLIEAFPEDRLFSFSVGKMRPFGDMAMELIGIAEPMVRGIVTDNWDRQHHSGELPRKEILQRWDESTENINMLWPRIPPARFQQTMTAFGQYPGRVRSMNANSR